MSFDTHSRAQDQAHRSVGSTHQRGEARSIEGGTRVKDDWGCSVQLYDMFVIKKKSLYNHFKECCVSQYA